MSIENRRETIGKTTYVIQQFGAKKGQSVLRRLGGALGGALGQFAAVDDPADAVAPAIEKVCSLLSDDDLSFITDACASCTKIVRIATMATGDQEILADLGPIYDDHFRGNWAEWAGWLGASLQLNYSSFLGGMDLTSLGNIIRRKQPSASPTP